MLPIIEALRAFFSIAIALAVPILIVLGIAAPEVEAPASPLPSAQETAAPPAESDTEAEEEAAGETLEIPPTDETSPEKFVLQGSGSPSPAPSEPQPPAPLSSVVDIPTGVNDQARSAVVNIFCETNRGNVTQTVTGSGVIIDPRGVILTNAHLAQFFLLLDYPHPQATECSIRTGNPARNQYAAKLFYIPITWVRLHAHEITLESPTGTGEGDYALVYITNPLEENGSPPASFPYLPLNTDEEAVVEGEKLLVASYPAIIPDSQAVENNLYLVSTATEVDTLFTFGSNLLDVFSLSGNIAAERGSSGGAVVNRTGELVGLVVTSTDNELVLDRTLRALTPAYINRDLQEENGTSLSQLLLGDLGLRAKAFELTTAPVLTKLLVRELERR